MSDMKTRIGKISTAEIYGSGKAIKSNKKHQKHIKNTMKRKGQLSQSLKASRRMEKRRAAIRAFSLGGEDDSSSDSDNDDGPTEYHSEWDDPTDEVQRVVPSFGKGSGPTKKKSRFTLKRHKRAKSQPAPPSLLAGFASEVAGAAIVKHPELEPAPLSTKKRPNLSRKSRSHIKPRKTSPLSASTDNNTSSVASLTPKQILQRENAKKHKKKRSFTFGRKKAKDQFAIDLSQKSLDDLASEAKHLNATTLEELDGRSPKKSKKHKTHRKLSSTEQKKIKQDQATTLMIEQFDQQVKQNAKVKKRAKKNVTRHSVGPASGHRKRNSVFSRIFRKSSGPENLHEEGDPLDNTSRSLSEDGSVPSSKPPRPEDDVSQKQPDVIPPLSKSQSQGAPKPRSESYVNLSITPSSPRQEDLPSTLQKSISAPAPKVEDNLPTNTENGTTESPTDKTTADISSLPQISTPTNSPNTGDDLDFDDILDDLEFNVKSPILSPKARRTSDAKPLLDSLGPASDLESMLTDLESQMSQQDSLNISIKLDELVSSELQSEIIDFDHFQDSQNNSSLLDSSAENNYDFDSMTDDELLLAMLGDQDDTLGNIQSPPPKSKSHGKLPTNEALAGIPRDLVSSTSPTARASPLPRLPRMGSAARSLSSSNLSDLEADILEDAYGYYDRFLKEKGSGFWERSDLAPPRIEIFEKVGKGATASVWRGEMIPDGGRGEPMDVAVKTISLFGVKDRKGTRRILRTEVEMMKDFAHPGVVQYFGMWYDKTTKEANIVMELVSGGTVQEPLDALGKFPEAICATIIFQVLEGLAFLHNQGIIHRDLKPDNMLISPEQGNIKITDFGTATQIVELQAKHRSTVGTAWYLSPEVVNAHPYTFPADIWSIGSCFLAMITGHPPFGDLDAVDCIFKLSSELPPIPTDISLEAQDFLGKCWKHDPAERATAEELLSHPFMNKCDQVTPEEYQSVVCSQIGLGSILSSLSKSVSDDSL